MLKSPQLGGDKNIYHHKLAHWEESDLHELGLEAKRC